MATKPALDLRGQVQLLAARGLIVGDETVAADYLYDTNYYRFAGFARQFQTDPVHGCNDFEPGTTLKSLIEIVELDARFTRRLMQALAVLECTVRARLALHLALRYGEEAFYLNDGVYVSSATLDDKVTDLIASVERELRRDRGRTVRRYAPNPYDLTGVPIWVAVELMSFGTVSRMLELFADSAVRDDVASSFGERHGTFVSTVHSLAVLRNRCAHHGQIWHRRLTIQTPTNGNQRRRARVSFDPQGPYAAVLAIQRMLGQVSHGREPLDAINKFLAAAPSRYLDGLYHPYPR